MEKGAKEEYSTCENVWTAAFHNFHKFLKKKKKKLKSQRSQKVYHNKINVLKVHWKKNLKSLKNI